MIGGDVSGAENDENSDVSIGIIYGKDSGLSVSNGTRVSSGRVIDGDYAISLSGLARNTKYFYCAYMSIGSTYYYGEVKSFTTTGDERVPGEAVDLGLSVKWASCNVGAATPEGYGGYYAWGETEEKGYYNESSYKFYDSSTINIGDEISGTSYDVARVKWGGNWRMPTKAEQQELIDSCTWTWTTQNGVNGYKVVGPNGNSIFLPAASDRNGTDMNYVGSYGDYWSGTLNECNASNAYGLHFDSFSPRRVGDYSRYVGFTVRPVVK